MKKGKMIGMGLLLGALILSGCGNGDKVNVKEERIRLLVRPILKKLEKLDIDYTGVEDDLVKDLSGFPEDMLEDSPINLVSGTIFNYLGSKEYLVSKGVASSQLDKIYSFDMEVMDIERMYSIFLNQVMALSKGELVFSDISEDLSAVDLENGTGTFVVRFVYKGKSYEYPAKFYYDWFDPEIVLFVNQVLEEHGNEKRLYGMSDGYQALILFYATEEWATAFNQAFKPDFELTK